MTKAAAGVLLLAATAQLGCADPTSPGTVAVDAAAQPDAGGRAFDTGPGGRSSDVWLVGDGGDTEGRSMPDISILDTVAPQDVDTDPNDSWQPADTGWLDAVEAEDAGAGGDVIDAGLADTAGEADSGPVSVDAGVVDTLDPLTNLPAWPPAS